MLARRARLVLVEPEAQPPRDDVPVDVLGLTPREAEVLTLVAQGRTNRQIAERLTISVKTASVHVSHILRKLNVPSRIEAAAIAHRITPMWPEGPEHRADAQRDHDRHATGGAR